MQAAEHVANLMEQLCEQTVLLADGAWGSWFIANGLDTAHEPAEAWNLHHAESVTELAREYARYADILTANTFGANRVRLAQYGRESEVERLNIRGVAIARDAAVPTGPDDGGILVAGALGPARGPHASHPDDSALYDIFLEQALHLVAAGADFLLIETMTDVLEARIAVRAARKAAETRPVVCSFAFRENDDGRFSTWSGHTVEAALGKALEAGADMVGANCVPMSGAIIGLCSTMRQFADTQPLWLKPNAGQPSRGGYPHPLTESRAARLLNALGTGVLGGCCGTGPADIALLRTVVTRHRHD